MIQVQSEKLIRLEDVRDYIPSSRKGKKLSKAIAFRWARRGVKGVVLETIRVGGARLTSVEAIQRFVDAQNSSHGSRRASAVTQRKAALKAEVELARLGI